MRWILGLAILVGIAPALHAQEPAGEEKQDPPKEGEEKKAEETPQEPKAFVLSEKDRKKVEKELNAFLVPSKKGRAEMARGLEKLDKKPIDGHSFMEDVTALTEISNHSRVFGSKAGRAGSVRSVDVPPEVLGHPIATQTKRPRPGCGHFGHTTVGILGVFHTSQARKRLPLSS